MSDDPDRLQPADIGALAWTHPPFNCNTYFNLGAAYAGRLVTFAFRVPARGTCRRIYSCGTAGTGLAGCYLGLYAVSRQGCALLGQSEDLSSAFGVLWYSAAPLDQDADLVPGVIYRVGVLFAQATTTPGIYGIGGAASTAERVNLGVAGNAQLVAAASPPGAGLTALPSWFEHQDMIAAPGFPSFVMSA